MIKWIGLTTIISCLAINLITGQSPFNGQNLANTAFQQQQSTTIDGKDQISLKTTSSNDNNVNGVNQIKNQLPLNQQQQQQQQQQLITTVDDNITPVIRSSNAQSDLIKQNSIEKQKSKEVDIKTKDDGEYKTLEEILNLAGLANVDALIPSSDPKSFMVKTRFKTKETSEKEEDDEKEEKETKEVKEKKKSKKKSTKKSSKKSKKSSKKSKKKSKKKKKKKKKKSCGCCCCCCK